MIKKAGEERRPKIREKTRKPTIEKEASSKGERNRGKKRLRGGKN